MLGLDSLRRPVRIASHVPLLVAGGIGLVGLVGYASALDDLYWHSAATSLAVPTGAAILLLVASALMLAPVEGVIAAVMRPSPGGRLLRRLLPVVVLVPAAFVIPIGRGGGDGRGRRRRSGRRRGTRVSRGVGRPRRARRHRSSR